MRTTEAGVRDDETAWSASVAGPRREDGGMRIGLVTPYSWSVPSGVNEHVAHLAAELEARGHQAWIIAPMGAAATPWRPANGGRPTAAPRRLISVGSAIAVPSNGSRAHVTVDPRAALRMERALRRHGFDLLHVHEPFAPVAPAAAVFLARRPVVATFHAALDSSALYTMGLPFMRMLAKGIDVRIAVSEAARHYPARHLGGRFHIIPNGISTEKYARAVSAERVPGRVCFVGRAERRKGLDVLVTAFAEVRRRRPEATLSVVGATRREIVEGLRVGGRPDLDLSGIEAHGWMAEDDKIDELAKAQLVCVPSLTGESFGIVLAEAMAAGTPVVASDLPGYRSVLCGGALGRLVPPGSPSHLAEAMDRLLADPDERRRLAAAGLTAARELSWTRVTDQIVRAYEEAFENHDVMRGRLTAPLRRRRRTRTPECPGDGRRPRERATTRTAGERDGRTDRVLVP